MSFLNPRDFYFEVAQGNVPGYSTMNKFGENPDIDTGTSPEDIWDLGGIYTWSTTADIDYIVSSGATDGVDILITGLDTNWEEVNQTISLNGQTPVALTTALIRVYRAVNMGSNDLNGNVAIYVSAGTSVTAGVVADNDHIRAYVRDGNNQTLMCIYTVPAGFNAAFIAGYVAFSKGQVSATADFSWRARPFGGVFQVKSKIGLVSTGSSVWSYLYCFQRKLISLSDAIAFLQIIVRCRVGLI